MTVNVPDPLKFPGMLRAVVPLWVPLAFIHELVAFALRKTARIFQSSGLLPGVFQVLPPSSERWIIWPNQPLDCTHKCGSDPPSSL